MARPARRTRLVLLCAALCAATFFPAACAVDAPFTPSTAVDYLIQSQSTGACVQPVGGSRDASAQLEVAPCTHAVAQRFRFVAGGGAFAIRNANSGLCLEPAAGATSPSTPIVQTSCRQAAAQLFSARLDGQAITLVAQGSGLALAVRTSGAAARLEQVPRTGDLSELFALVAQGDASGGSSSGGSGSSSGSFSGSSSGGTASSSSSSGSSSSGSSSSGSSSSGSSSSGSSSSGSSSSSSSSSGSSSSGSGSSSGASSGSSSGGASSGSSSSGGSSGSSSSGAGCTRGQTKGSEVAVIGESFIALSHGITQQIEKDAKAAGSLGQGEHYVDNSVSGTTLANDQIPSQYRKAVQSSGKIRYVLMDGGGNDCLIRNDGDAALAAATSLFQTMAQDHTEKVVYFFYPDPIGGNFANLKRCLDALRPKMKALCDGLTAPKCHWLDLRSIWNGHPEYTSDGIHPTSAGSTASGDAIWKVMQDNCVAQ